MQEILKHVSTKNCLVLEYMYQVKHRHYIVSNNKFFTFLSHECTENFEMICTYE